MAVPCMDPTRIHHGPVHVPCTDQSVIQSIDHERKYLYSKMILIFVLSHNQICWSTTATKLYFYLRWITLIHWIKSLLKTRPSIEYKLLNYATFYVDAGESGLSYLKAIEMLLKLFSMKRDIKLVEQRQMTFDEGIRLMKKMVRTCNSLSCSEYIKSKLQLDPKHFLLILLIIYAV